MKKFHKTSENALRKKKNFNINWFLKRNFLKHYNEIKTLGIFLLLKLYLNI